MSEKTQQDGHLDTLHNIATLSFIQGIKEGDEQSVQMASTFMAWHEPDDWLRFIGWDSVSEQERLQEILGFDPRKHGFTGDGKLGHAWRGIQKKTGLTMAFSLGQFMIEVTGLVDPASMEKQATLSQLQSRLDERFRFGGFVLSELGRVSTIDEQANMALAAQRNEKLLIDCTLGLLRKLTLEREALARKIPDKWFSLLAEMALYCPR